MKLLRKKVCDLGSYTVDQDYSVAKLNQNESPYDIVTSLKEDVAEKIRKAQWNRYPDSRCIRLRKLLSGYCGHDEAGIIIGNSSNEIIRMIYSACCRSDDKIVIIEPGFVVFKRTCDIMGLNSAVVSLKDDFSFDVDGIITEAKGAKLVMLASPNNPTGTWLNLEEVDRIASSVDCIFALDEAYFEYSSQDASCLLGKHKNLVIIRTFSKAMSLAGIRIGYFLGDADIAYQMEKAKMPFSVGWFPQIAGEVILENYDYIRKNTQTIISERNRVFNRLLQMENVEPIESKTNFIMFRLLRHSSAEIEKFIRSQGILIRRFGGSRLEDKLRVTIGLPEENDAFLEALARGL